MNEQDFMLLIREYIRVIYRSRYVPLVLAMPLLLWSWAAVFPILGAIVVIYGITRVRSSVNEFALYVCKDQSWMVEESVDKAQGSNFTLLMVSALLIILNAAFIPFSTKVSPWFYYNVLAVLVYILYAVMSWQLNHEMEKLKLAINIYNQLK